MWLPIHFTTCLRRGSRSLSKGHWSPCFLFFVISQLCSLSKHQWNSSISTCILAVACFIYIKALLVIPEDYVNPICITFEWLWSRIDNACHPVKWLISVPTMQYQCRACSWFCVEVSLEAPLNLYICEGQFHTLASDTHDDMHICVMKLAF